MMNNNIYKVAACGAVFQVKSEKSETGTLAKRPIVLKELGGRYADEYAATLLGNAALCEYAPGDLVAAALRFTTHEHNGQVYQDVTITYIHNFIKRI